MDSIQYYSYLASSISPQVLKSASPRQDFTVISITLGEEPRYVENLKTWLVSGPQEVIVITVERSQHRIEQALQVFHDARIRVLTVPEPDFRQQPLVGIQHVRTDLMVKVDDRVSWSPRTLLTMMAAFEDPAVGGVSTQQRVVSYKGPHHDLTSWESFGALNLVRRNILHSALALFNRGQVLNISGASNMYRTKIFQNSEYYTALQNDYWCGRIQLRTGDDNFSTNWALHHGWKTAFVRDISAGIHTYVCHDSNYLHQLLRWSRDTARYYIRDTLFVLQQRDANHALRCLLNWLFNYLSDFAIITEWCFLLCHAVYHSGPHSQAHTG